MSFARERWGQEPTWQDHAVGFGLCALYVVLLLCTADSIGLGRDEGIYVDAAQRYAGWLELLVKEPGRALTSQGIDSAFSANHEHPPLMKLLFGLGYLAQRELHLFGSESQSFRFAGMLSAGGLLWIIYLFATRLYGRAAGLFAAASLALLPRPFYHAHLNAFDVPITCASTLVLYNYYVALERPRRALLVGVTFGLALLTKHNSWLLPIMMLAHFGLCALVERRARKQGQPKRLSLVPWSLIALCIGPLLFYAGWPWLWHDTWPRLRNYVAFHTHHEYYNMEYFGVNYFWPPFPMSYAWVMTLYTVPLTTLSLGIAGAGRSVASSVRDLRALFAPRTAACEADPTQPTALILGAMLAPLLAITLPSTPIFGGTKHWFPAYPMLAIFAGRAFVEAVALLARRGSHEGGKAGRILGSESETELTVKLDPNSKPSPSPRLPVIFSSLLAVCLLLPAAVETAHSHPFALSHYTAIAGGVPGAAEKGMNRQFWGFTTRSLVPYLLEAMPNGGTLYICDTLYGSFQMLIRDGHLPASFRATPDIARADYALVHHEKHFAEVDHQIWTTYRTAQPAHVLLYDGVPIISVYQNPKHVK